jgi:hypothetical protein
MIGAVIFHNLSEKLRGKSEKGKGKSEKGKGKSEESYYKGRGKNPIF